MGKIKVFFIIFLAIILAIGFIALKFYNEKNELEKKVSSLKEDNQNLLHRNKKLSLDKENLENENEILKSRLNSIQSELSRLEQEREEMQRRYEKVVSERDALMNKLKERPKIQVKKTPQERAPSSGDLEYWADFVKKKNELQVKLEKLQDDFIKAKTEVAELTRSNKELKLKIDELTQQQRSLQEELDFKEKTLSLMSRDLVNEREARKNSMQMLSRLKKENVSLKREIVFANKQKIKLQEQLNEALAKKKELENRIFQVENVLKEKRLAFEELQETLNESVSGADFSQPGVSSVELPPIMVSPNTAVNTKEKIEKKGKILAVNTEERFVVVDMGETSGIKTGMPLKVLRSGEQIATLSVIETRKDISAADIKSLASGVQIREGDTVVVGE